MEVWAPASDSSLVGLESASSVEYSCVSTKEGRDPDDAREETSCHCYYIYSSPLSELSVNSVWNGCTKFIAVVAVWTSNTWATGKVSDAGESDASRKICGEYGVSECTASESKGYGHMSGKATTVYRGNFVVVECSTYTAWVAPEGV